MMRLLGVILLAMVVVSVPAASQSDDDDDGEWRVVAVTTLPESANSLAMGSEYLVSPDGTHLTWLNANPLDASNKICLMALPSNIRLCYAIPPTYPSPSLLSWSPDLRHILLLDGYGEFLGEFIFDVATREFLTVKRENILLTDAVWNATSDAVFYLSYHSIDNTTSSTTLHRFSLDSGTETLYDLTPVIGQPTLFNDFVPISDTRFVLLFTHYAPRNITPGLWLVDIDAQTAELLVLYDDLQLAVRPESNRTPEAGDLVWDAEQERLLISLQSTSPQFGTISVLSVDLETRAIVPLVTAGEFGTDASGFHGGMITPDGEFFFYFAESPPELPYKKTISAVPLVSTDHASIMVTDKHPIDCLPRTALITLEHADGSQRRYVYAPHIFCPG